MNTATPIEGPGTVWAMKQIMAHFYKAAPKPKPKAEKADPELDEPARCPTCLGDADEDENDYMRTCPDCDGKGYIRSLQSALITVYRDFDEILCQVSVKDGKILDAWVVNTVGDPGQFPRYASGSGMLPLTMEEEAAVLEAVSKDTGCQP